MNHISSEYMNREIFFKRFWRFEVIAMVSVVVFVLCGIIFFTRDQSDDLANDQGDANANDMKSRGSSGNQSNQQIVKNASAHCPPVFTVPFTDYDKIDAFQPIGSITGASRGRSYITVKEGETVPVYAPADATLISVIYAYRGTGSDHGEYGFKFDTGCGVMFLLDHLDSASEEMKRYAPVEPSRSTATQDMLSIPIRAGTLLWYTNGTSQARTFDFLVIDNNSAVFHINPERWEWDQSLYSVCPYDFYKDDLKEKYFQKIGIRTNDGFLKSENCGRISLDVSDTLSGGWFPDDSSTDLHGEFLLIGERMGAVDIVIKTDSEQSKLQMTDYHPNKTPENVKIGQLICYQGFANDWVYFHVIDARTVELTRGAGACPSRFPSTNVKKYYR